VPPRVVRCLAFDWTHGHSTGTIFTNRRGRVCPHFCVIANAASFPPFLGHCLVPELRLDSRLSIVIVTTIVTTIATAIVTAIVTTIVTMTIVTAIVDT
jgi:hypothetical protein